MLKHKFKFKKQGVIMIPIKISGNEHTSSITLGAGSSFVINFISCNYQTSWNGQGSSTTITIGNEVSTSGSSKAMSASNFGSVSFGVSVSFSSSNGA